MTTKNDLRAMVRGAYDLQKLRMTMGLRLVANFKAKIGQAPQEAEEEMGEDAIKFLDQLRESYNRLTDGIAKNRTLPSREGFKGDELISDYTELVLVSHYLELEKVEKRQFRQLENILPDFPVYEKFLKDVTGIGSAMAGVIISEFDISRARYVSSLWAYAGLDTVTGWKLKDMNWSKVNPAKAKPDFVIETECQALLRANGTNGPITLENGEVREVRYLPRNTDDNKQSAVLSVSKDGYAVDAVYELVDLGGRSRKRAHLVKRKYIDKNGKEQERDSITYNPFLKSKLMGVLAVSFLRTGSEYREAYDGYKHRLQSDPRKADWSKGHINEASKRYMVKMFLADLYVKWRTLEGLSVAPSYAERKLGMEPHGGIKPSAQPTTHRPDAAPEASAPPPAE